MIALGPTPFDSDDCCEVMSIVVDRGELAVRVVADGLANVIL